MVTTDRDNEGIGRNSSSGLINDVLRAARRQLDMEFAFIAEAVDDREVFRWVDGAKEAVTNSLDGWTLGERLSRQVLEGEGSLVIADVRRDDRVADPSAAEGKVSSFVGAPVRFADGRIYGTLCCMNGEPKPDLDRRAAEYLGVLADLLGRELERRELEERAWQAEVESTGISALLGALAARDGYTCNHSEAVVELAEKISSRLGLEEDEAAEVRQVALLHDIGKIGVPDVVLRKPGPLDATEWRLMREHPVIGARILGGIPGLMHLCGAVRAEHERWDGGGYPDGLKGEQIPTASRVILVCDAYHSMISNRPYRSALPEHVARKEIEDNAGTQFGPREAESLLAVLRDEVPTIIEDQEGESPLKILIVDDDPSVQMLLRYAMETLGGFEVVAQAGDGAEALAIVRMEKPDAVILDLSMPVVDGLAAIPEIRTASPGTRILVFSASDSDVAFEEALARGAHVCVRKGAPMTTLIDAVKAPVVDPSGSLQEAEGSSR